MKGASQCYRLCFETVMTILYQVRGHKVTNKSICEALFCIFEKLLNLMIVQHSDMVGYN